MKKIENILFWPVLILLFFCASKYGAKTTDIHLHDTYFIVPNSYVAGTFVLWLLLVIFLLKRIRHRHQVVNTKIVITCLVLTLLLPGAFLWLGLVNGGSAAGNFTTADLDALLIRNQLRAMCIWCFLLVQVIFLIYFFIQIVKKPVPSGL